VSDVAYLNHSKKERLVAATVVDDVVIEAASPERVEEIGAGIGSRTSAMKYSGPDPPDQSSPKKKEMLSQGWITSLQGITHRPREDSPVLIR